MLLLLFFLLAAIPAVAQDAAACKAVLLEALRRHHAVPDSGTAVRRVMRITTVRRLGTRLDTTVNTAETIEWKGGQLMRAGGVEVWSDAQTMAMVEETTKRIRLIDLSGERKLVSAQARFNAGYADSLVVYGRSFRCEEAKGKGRFVRFEIDTTMQGFFNAAEMGVEIDGAGEIRRMEITHPNGSPVQTTEYVVEELERAWRMEGVGEPVLGHFLDAEGKARSAYAGYRITRQ